MASLVQRNGTYYAQFHDASRSPKRKRISLRSGKKSIATRLLVRIEDAYALGTFDPWTQGVSAFFDRTKEPATVQEALDAFLDEKKQSGRSQNTLNSYRWIVGQWSREVGAETTLASVRPADIQPFVRDPSVAQSTRNTRYRHVRAFLRWCSDQDYIGRPPTEAVERPEKAHKLPQRFTRQPQGCVQDASEGLQRKAPGRAVCAGTDQVVRPALPVCVLHGDAHLGTGAPPVARY